MRPRSSVSRFRATSSFGGSRHARRRCSRLGWKRRSKPPWRAPSRQPPERHSGSKRLRGSRATRPPLPWSRGRGSTRPTSGSGCGGYPALLASMPTGRPATSPMKSSKWSAHGNVYLLVEGERLTPERARELSQGGETDGVVEIVDRDGAEATVAIWNPDGSRAEMSGNGTRIAAAWLAEQTGASEVAVRVGDRLTNARVVGDRIEQRLGRTVVGKPAVVEGIEMTPVSVGNPHAVVVGDPAEIDR